MTARSIGRILGRNSGNNLISTANVTANLTGSLLERMEALQQALGVGGVFWIKKTLTSNEITIGGVDITNTSQGGELVIEDIILQTDSTGLAGGTNFLITSDNSKGAPTILSHAVSSLGANVTLNLSAATVKSPCVLEIGRKLMAKMTVSNGTGSGTIDVRIKFRRLAAGATITAV